MFAKGWTMKPLNPVTATSKSQALSLAREIAARYPDYYGTVPLAYLALNIRELQRFCEDSNIWEPADLAMVVQAMFKPSPNCLSKNDCDYAIGIISNVRTAPEARARSVSQALTGVAPPSRKPSGHR